MRLVNRPGFTFIELLTVMVVIGALATVGVPRIRTMKERAYQATLRSDLGTLRTAQEAYYAEHQQYATDVSALDFRLSDAGEHVTGFRDTARAHQPARTLRDAEERHEKCRRGQRSDTKLPAPLRFAQARSSDQVVRKIRQQDSEDDVELEESNEAPALVGRRDFGDVHGTDHR